MAVRKEMGKGVHLALRKAASKVILDFVETLPAFQGGRIHHLQIIRHHQRKTAKRLLNTSTRPENASIALKSTTLVFFYELERSQLVNKRLKKTFSTEHVASRIDQIIENEGRLDGLSWTNLGSVSTKDHRANWVGLDIQKVDALPLGAAMASFSQYRVLPSLSALEVIFENSTALSESLNKEAELFRLPEVVTKSLWPKRLLRGYSMAGDTDAREAVTGTVNDYSSKYAEWVWKFLRLNKASLQLRAAIPCYEISRQEHEGSLAEFFEKNRQWAYKFGYGMHAGHENYNSEDFVVSVNDHTAQVRRDIAFIEANPNNDSDNFEKSEILQSVALHAATVAQAAKYKSDFENLRVSALRYIGSKWRRLHKSAGMSGRLKLMTLFAQRMAAELKETAAWSFTHTGAEGLARKEFHSEKTHSFAHDSLWLTRRYLKQISSSSNLISSAVSEQVMADNIAATYQLQRTVFWLTLVSAFVGVVGLLAVWDKLKHLSILLWMHRPWIT